MGRIVFISDNNVGCRNDLFSIIKEGLSFPEYCGDTLDSLFDCFTEYGEEAELVIDISGNMREAMEGSLEKFIRMMTDAVSENPKISFYIKNGRS